MIRPKQVPNQMGSVADSVKTLNWNSYCESPCVFFQTMSWPIPNSCVIFLNPSPDSSPATGLFLMASDSSFHPTAPSTLISAELHAGQASLQMFRRKIDQRRKERSSPMDFIACVRTDGNQVYTTFQTHLSRSPAITSVSSSTCGGCQASRLAPCTDHSGRC